MGSSRLKSRLENSAVSVKSQFNIGTIPRQPQHHVGKVRRDYTPKSDVTSDKI